MPGLETPVENRQLQEQKRLGWDAAWVEKRISPLRDSRWCCESLRSKMTGLGAGKGEQATARQPTLSQKTRKDGPPGVHGWATRTGDGG
jgi:hypothetical protein